MAQNPAEVQEITTLCRATLLNLGVPDEEKFKACILAGKKANELGRPVVLDPVGAGASRFRQQGLKRLLEEVRPSIIRCNQEEALVLLSMRGAVPADMTEGLGGVSGGVESSVSVNAAEQRRLARRLAEVYHCTAFISGRIDVISDGEQLADLSGGDERMARITGSGCMLSALCGLFCGTGMDAWEAACTAGKIWKESSCMAGYKTDQKGGGIGTFHRYLFDALDELCHGSKEEEG